MDTKKTPLFNEHHKLGARCAPFGGWFMPIQYNGIITEHQWTRISCSIFDICHMGEFKLKAEPGKGGLEEIFTINLSKMPVMSCRYGFMLNDNGGVIDDVIIYKEKEDEFMLVVNAAATAGDFAHIKQCLSSGAQIEDISINTCKLDLQGPLSRDVLKSIVGPDIAKLRFYSFGFFSLLGQMCIISRTGYTGELGYELYIGKDNAGELWELLLKDKRVEPAGLGARDTLRLEVGYPLYGADIDLSRNPIEAGLESFVDFEKDFKGKAALEKFKAAGIGEKMACFISKSRRAPRHNYKIYSNAKQIGIVTSGSFSPSLSCGIGMGYIDNRFTIAGTRLMLKDGNVEIEAEITKKPFYKNGTARMK